MLPDLAFHVVGVSHHTAGVEVREKFAFTPLETAAWLERRREARQAAVLLSTCNRCEVYWSGEDDLESWFRDFARTRNVAAERAVVRLDGADAVRHLFAVTAGLDSQILGETEILGQVRRAYDAARLAGTTDRTIENVFRSALAAGRRVRRETRLGRHPASVSSAAVDVAASALGGLDGRRAVVVGAGEVAVGVLRALTGHRISGVALVNRRTDRASAVAAAWGAVLGSWDELDALLSTADLLFVTTGAARPVISAARLAEALGAEPKRQLTVFDLSLPRNVEPAAAKVRGVRLHDLDGLQRLRSPADGFTAPGLLEAQRLLAEEIVRLERTLHARAAAPRLAELHLTASRLAEEEADCALAQLRHLSESDQQVVREMAERLVRRLMYPVSRGVREESAPDRCEDEQLTA